MKKEKRDIRIVFFIFTAIFSALAFKYYPSLPSYALMGLILLILPITVFSPFTLRPAFRLWLKVAHIIGSFNTQVLLAIVFICIFIPLGLAMRIFRKDPLKRQMEEEGTYWESYELAGVRDNSRYENQF